MPSSEELDGWKCSRCGRGGRKSQTEWWIRDSDKYCRYCGAPGRLFERCKRTEDFHVTMTGAYAEYQCVDCGEVWYGFGNARFCPQCGLYCLVGRGL